MSTLDIERKLGKCGFGQVFDNRRLIGENNRATGAAVTEVKCLGSYLY